MDAVDLKLALVLGLLAVSACGSGAQGTCRALDSCGGDPAGSWTVQGGDVCQVKPIKPAQPQDVTDFMNTTGAGAPTIAPPQPNPVVVQQTTSGDWCSTLVYNPDDSVSNAKLYHEAPDLVDGTFKLFAADHSYLTDLLFSTENLPVERRTTFFAPRCLLADGGHPTCAKLEMALTKFFEPANPTVPPNYGNFSCHVPAGTAVGLDAPDVGCECSYVFKVAVADQGTWLVQNGNVLLQDSTVFTYNGIEQKSQSPNTSIHTIFCSAGGSLQLSGERGGSLFGIQGLRTLVLVPAP
jgi:hypothetical protein